MTKLILEMEFEGKKTMSDVSKNSWADILDAIKMASETLKIPVITLRRMK